MGHRRHTAEQIIHKLREAEVELAKGSTVPVVVEMLGITEQTFYRWRKEYGGLHTDQAMRLKALARENARLKRMLAEAHLGQHLPHHDADAYLLLRIDGDKEEELLEVSEAVAEICMAHHAIDVLVADTREAQARIWDIRGRFYEALVENRVVELVDTVVPPSRVAEFMAEVKRLSATCEVEIMGFGHAGDGLRRFDGCKPLSESLEINISQLLECEKRFIRVARQVECERILRRPWA